MLEKEADKGKESVGEKGFRTPGLRGAQTTTLFRAVNPELFIKPVRSDTHSAVSQHGSVVAGHFGRNCGASGCWVVAKNYSFHNFNVKYL